MSCAICLEPLRALHVFQCGHGGCAVCISVLVKSAKICHECRAPITAISPVWPLISEEKLTDEDRGAMATLKSRGVLPVPRLFSRPNIDRESELRDSQLQLFDALWNSSFPTRSRTELRHLAQQIASRDGYVERFGRAWWIYFSSMPSRGQEVHLCRLAVAIVAPNIVHVPHEFVDAKMAERAMDGGAPLRFIPAAFRSTEICIFAVRRDPDEAAAVPLIRLTKEFFEVQHLVHRAPVPPQWREHHGAISEFLIHKPDEIPSFAEGLSDIVWMNLINMDLPSRHANLLPTSVRAWESVMTRACTNDPGYFSLVDASIIERVAVKVLAARPDFYFRIPLVLRTPALRSLISDMETGN